jgi:hypothetical protein
MFIDGCNAFNPAPAMSDTCEASAPGAEPDATLGLVVDHLEIELREQLAFDVKRGMAEGLAEVRQLLQVGGQVAVAGIVSYESPERGLRGLLGLAVTILSAVKGAWAVTAVFALLAGGFLMRAAERYWKGGR